MLIRNLGWEEVLLIMDPVATDKTGTVRQNRKHVAALVYGAGPRLVHEHCEVLQELLQQSKSLQDAVVRCIVWRSHAEI